MSQVSPAPPRKILPASLGFNGRGLKTFWRDFRLLGIFFNVLEYQNGSKFLRGLFRSALQYGLKNLVVRKVGFSLFLVRPERVNQGIKNANDFPKPHEISQYHEFSYQIIKKSLTRLSEIILSV